MLAASTQEQRNTMLSQDGEARLTRRRSSSLRRKNPAAFGMTLAEVRFSF
jgi:hypothetical protein